MRQDFVKNGVLWYGFILMRETAKIGEGELYYWSQLRSGVITKEGFFGRFLNSWENGAN